MAHGDHNSPKPNKLSVEELRKYPGNESLSDEQLEEQSNTLLEFSIILYKLYQQQCELSEDFPHSLNAVNQDFRQDQPEVDIPMPLEKSLSP